MFYATLASVYVMLDEDEADSVKEAKNRIIEERKKLRRLRRASESAGLSSQDEPLPQ
jgi:hypothetical protein